MRRSRHPILSSTSSLLFAVASSPLTAARPVLPFLYPFLNDAPQPPKRVRSQQQQATASSSPSASTSSTSTTTAVASTSTSEKLPLHLAQGDDGSYQPRCWKLHGQTNCPVSGCSVIRSLILSTTLNLDPNYRPTPLTRTQPSSTTRPLPSIPLQHPPPLRHLRLRPRPPRSNRTPWPSP